MNLANSYLLSQQSNLVRCSGRASEVVGDVSKQVFHSSAISVCLILGDETRIVSHLGEIGRNVGLSLNARNAPQNIVSGGLFAL